MAQTAPKILILRFSSFGDVVQSLSIPAKLKQHYPEAHIHWATREDFAPLIEHHPNVDQLWTIKKGSSIGDIIKLARELRKLGFTHVYDAHNSLRSKLISLFLSPKFFARKSSKRLKRFLLFKLRINLYEQPFSGQRDLLEPLQKWKLAPLPLPSTPQFFPSEQMILSSKERLSEDWTRAIALAPSAAHALKRWPVEYWKKLIEICPDEKFILLGGPEDQFIGEIEAVCPERCLNLAGKLSLLESSALLIHCKALIANDTGLMHVGEQLGLATIALMGPAPFGFPSRSSTSILEVPLSCRPCSKHGQGPCVNPEFQKCLRDITPDMVAETLKMRLKSQPKEI